MIQLRRTLLAAVAALVLAACAHSARDTRPGASRAEFFAELGRSAGPDATHCGWSTVGRDVTPGFACVRDAAAAHRPFHFAWQFFDGKNDTWVGVAGNATGKFWQVTYTTRAGRRSGVPHPEGVAVMPCTSFDPGSAADSRINCAFSAPP
jgi:hypothetical protein